MQLVVSKVRILCGRTAQKYNDRQRCITIAARPALLPERNRSVSNALADGRAVCDIYCDTGFFRGKASIKSDNYSPRIRNYRRWSKLAGSQHPRPNTGAKNDQQSHRNKTQRLFHLSALEPRTPHIGTLHHDLGSRLCAGEPMQSAHARHYAYVPLYARSTSYQTCATVVVDY